ncbi:MAG TPA: cyclase family protein [Acidimicrobiales bacterium]|jgi:kynurenine formamidase|nr:cyclase family protein [Acidimicrobiales bacterium]
MPTVIDLSHFISDGTVTYPGLPGPKISDHLSREASREHYAPGTEFHIGRIEMVGNTGTYLDTPFHRYSDGYDLAELSLERVAAVPGVVVDARGGTEIGPAVLDGRPRAALAGRAVLFRTGWDRHWGTERYGDPEHPHLAEATAERLVDAGAALVGIDSVNIDGTRSGERPIHSVLLAAGIPIVEHLRGLDQLGDLPFRFFAVPPALLGMGSFPVRALAVLA